MIKGYRDIQNILSLTKFKHRECLVACRMFNLDNNNNRYCAAAS